MGELEILLPTPPRAAGETSTVFSHGKGLQGAIVGLRLDASWRSYYTVVDVWTERFQAAGADVRVLWTGDRAGPEADRTRDDVEEWSRLVEIGVVGLGN